MNHAIIIFSKNKIQTIYIYREREFYYYQCCFNQLLDLSNKMKVPSTLEILSYLKMPYTHQTITFSSTWIICSTYVNGTSSFEQN